MPMDRDQKHDTSVGSPSARTPFTRDMILEVLKQAEPGVAELSKRLKETASRPETASTLRLR